MSTFGTYDTMKLTSLGVQTSDIREPDSWSIGSGTTVEDAHMGNLSSLYRLIYLDKHGKEVEPGSHTSTIGLKHSLLPTKGGGQLTVIDIPAPAALMGKPTGVLLPNDLPGLVERVSTIVDRHIGADIGAFNVGRIDSSTIWDVPSEVSSYIGMLNAITPQQQKRSNKKLYEGECVQFVNKSSAVGFYDKGAKDEHRGIDAGPGNKLRYEDQRKRKAAVNAVYGPLCFADIVKPSVILRAVQDRAIQFDRFFPFNHEKAKEFTGKYNAAIYAAQNKRRGAFESFCMILAVQEGLVKVSDVNVLFGDHYSAKQIKRIEKKIQDASGDFITGRDLYYEIKLLIDNELKLAS
jgi:hypothetical protein